MKLYERLGDPGFHTSVISTFGIDFDAYENIALSRLRGSGCNNNIVLVDERMLTHALGGASARPQSAGRLYSVTGAKAAGVFHPKVILQLGRHRGRIIVSSANLTASGLAGNLELCGVIDCDANPSGAQELIVTAWHFFRRLLDRERKSLQQQLWWMENRTPWLPHARQADSPIALQDKSVAEFLGTESTIGILARFVNLCGNEPVLRLTILSPYWDEDLAAAHLLITQLKPKGTTLLIDKARGLFPGAALKRLSRTKLYDISPISNGRFIHAKLIIASTTSADHVLYGSANCTHAALGSLGVQGHNEEACLYRRLPPSAAYVTLGLDKVLADAPEIQAAALPPFQRSADLPLDDLAKRFPGIFECVFSTLYWQMPSGLAVHPLTVELLNVDGSRMSCTLKRESDSGIAEVRFRISDTDSRPAFAQVRFPDGTVSTPAVVTVLDFLQREVREVRGKRADRVITMLTDETEEGLWLLEALDEMEAADPSAEDALSRIAKRRNQEDNVPENYRLLSYDQFLVGRTSSAPGSTLERNSLAGTEQSIVRGFLNRILCLSSGEITAKTQNEEALILNAFNLGDEVRDAEGSIEKGETFGSFAGNQVPRTKKEREEEAARRRAIQRRATREQIVDAIEMFGIRLKVRAKDGSLGSAELLRLRALLTIAAAAGQSGKSANHGDKSSYTELQVLPLVGSDCWPRLLARIVHGFFGGKKPPILFLRIHEIHDEIPDDFMECWSCCFWALQASSFVTPGDGSFFGKSLKQLTTQTYKLTGLHPDELLGDRVLEVMQKMVARFGERLGLDANALMNAHRRSVESLMRPIVESVGNLRRV